MNALMGFVALIATPFVAFGAAVWFFCSCMQVGWELAFGYFTGDNE